MSTRANILLIMTDQHSAHMLGSAGTDHVHTPNLDALAAAGTRYERAYVTFPLCVPSRTSMMTGVHPHQIGVHGNAPGAGPAAVRGPGSLPRLLAAAGYDCAYAGKWHAAAPSASEDDGFEVIHAFGDRGLVASARDYLANRDGGRPFFLVASFDDPHTICEVARRQPSYYGELPAVEPSAAPNLPVNFGSHPFEPEAIRAEQRAGEKVYGTGSYTPQEWRAYRAHYAALVHRADARIGELLSVLRETGQDEHTLVVFTSDHGDGDSAHSWNQKTALFEEIVRVPLILHRPGHVGAGVVDDSLVSTGLDLLPTLCTAAGTTPPAGLPGRSLLGAADRRASGGRGGAHAVPTPDTGASAGPDHVIVETTFADGPGPHTRGRAVIGRRFKYVLYSWGRYREQLHDLQSDPGEQVNLAVEGRYHDLLEEFRTILLDWCRETGDATMLKRLVLPVHTPEHVREEVYAVPY